MDPLRIDIVDGCLSTSGFTVRRRPLAQCTGTSEGGAAGPNCPADPANAAGSEVHLVPATARHTPAGVLYARMLADTADPVAFLEAVAPASSPDSVHFRIDLDPSGRVTAARGPDTAVTVLTRWEDAPETLVVDPRIPVATVLLERALRRRGARIERTDRNFLVGTAPDGRPLLAKDARTDLNGMPAVRAAERKDVARSLLARAGVAIPGGDSFGPAADPAEAFDLLARLGTVVVKPVDGDKGRGVTVGVTGRDRLREAWDLARRETRAGILVEEVRTGEEVRILVIDGRARAAARRVPPHVTGDGSRTVRELINAKNARRRTSFYLQGKPIVLTPHRLRLLADAGLTPLSVLGPGQRCDLDATGNVRTGAEPVDATDTIDPTYLRIAERAVAAVPGLRTAGVDLMGDDLETPAVAGDHAVLELNPNPGMGIHAGAQGGGSRDIAGALADAVLSTSPLPTGAPLRVQDAAERSEDAEGDLTGAEAATEAPRTGEADRTSGALLAAAFRARGFTVRWVSSRGFFAQRADRVHGVWGATTDRTAHAAVFALSNPNAAHELLEYAAVPVLEGRGFSRSEREEVRAYAARWSRVAVHGGTHRPILVDAASAEAFDVAWDAAAQHATALGVRVTRAAAGPGTRALVAHGEVLAIVEEGSACPEPGTDDGAERREERALALAAVAALPGLDLAEVVVVPTEKGAAVAHIRVDPDLAAFGDRAALTVERIADRIVGLHTGMSDSAQAGRFAPTEV